MLDSEGCAVMNSGGERERAAYSRVRRLWAARVAMVRVCVVCEEGVGGMSCDSGGCFEAIGRRSRLTCSPDVPERRFS